MKETEQIGPKTPLHSDARKLPEVTSSSYAEFGLPLMVMSDDGAEEFEVRLFELTTERISFLWAMAQKYNIVLPDYMRKDRAAFINMVMAPSTVLLSVNNFGVVYATDLVPGDSAMLHYLFWDRGQKNRQKLLLTRMKWMCDTFHIHRMTCTIPRFATAALHRVHVMGFRLEGFMREAMKHNGKWADCFIFGIMSRELTEDALDRGWLARSTLEHSWYSIFRDDPILLHKVLRRTAWELGIETREDQHSSTEVVSSSQE